jgi:aromatic-L-amino-acid decarboxylase
MTYPLEPDRDAMLRLGQAATDFVADFVTGFDGAPAQNVSGRPDPALRAAVTRPPGEGPSDPAQLIETFGAAAAQVVETAGPGYLAYIPGGGVFASALAEFMARAANRYTALAAFAPELVAMESGVLDWLGYQFGMPAGNGGLVTTGGSMATLSAVVAARHDRLGEAFTDGTIYLTVHAHHCVAKAARIAGFPAARIRVVPTTADLRMDVDAAARMIAADRATGLRPFLLVANAGSTDTGTVDRLPALGRLAAREDLWFHVDAAYGGFFQLTKRGRETLTGVESADSIVLDPHKGLFLPYGTGVLLVRDAAPLRTAHSGEAHYLQDIKADQALPDFSSLGPELTREFRGLRIWLPLHLHGVAAFRDTLDEKLDLAAHAHADLAADQALDLPWEPDLSTVVFRLRRGGEDASLRLLERINAARTVFLSSTRINGRVMLRLSILSHRTHREHIDRALDLIHAQAARQL